MSWRLDKDKLSLPDKPFLSPAQAGKLFGLGAGKIKQWAKARKIIFFRTEGGHYRVSVASLRQHIDSLMVGEKKGKEPVYTMD